MEKTIAPEHVLPCDFIVGSMIFRKGVKLETLRVAAERWLRAGAEAVKPGDTTELEKLVAQINDGNLHPPVES